jgi:2-phospho-L-lactate/phosphoenolpyruvate guanylyltransferase
VPDHAVLVPVKSFRRAKERLAGVADVGVRSELARNMAARVLEAARPAPVFVVCDDDEVATWATTHRAEVIWRPGHGLDGAVGGGVSALQHLGIPHVVVAHADLPLARSFEHLAAPGIVSVVPDLRRDGTNVISLPTGTAFTFSYGARSFERHVQRAERLGLEVRVVADELLALDVDVPTDLDHPALAWLRAIISTPGTSGLDANHEADDA